VLDLLKAYQVQATFFCVGENVQAYPDVYERIIAEGHAIGNHSWSHPNGWNTSKEKYLEDVRQAAELIDTKLFRPPYGRITFAQAKQVPVVMNTDAAIIMWDVLSADFDPAFSPQQCLKNVIDHYESGSIIVFHDSEKAFPNLSFTLPLVLENLKKAGYSCRKIEV
jgi:peptidoglycan/xylan/chitin deacetylase (PgdA/CDA1 family)